MMYNLLLQSDLNTIKKLCITNQQANKICRDMSFWKNKYMNDYPIYDNPVNWKNEYIKMTNVIKEADNILTISNIEKENYPYKDHATPGVIMLELQSRVNYKVKFLGDKILNMVDKILENNEADVFAGMITITPINDKYELYYNFYDEDLIIDEGIKTIIAYKDVKKILIGAIYDNTKNDNIMIMDDYEDLYIPKKEYDINLITGTGIAMYQKYYRRKGMLDILNL